MWCDKKIIRSNLSIYLDTILFYFLYILLNILIWLQIIFYYFIKLKFKFKKQFFYCIFKSILNIRKLNANKLEEFLKSFEKLCDS